ncbi:MAG TPA: formylglycine-generating enzyme family protein [Bryobacteraceae bacterium]
MFRSTFICFLLALPAIPQTTKSTTGMEFVKVVPGEFMMGCSSDAADCTGDERPAHSVQIAKAFEIGKYEVTQAQWVAVMGSNPSTIKGDDHPVETVSKNDVHAFLDKLNAKGGGFKYRLPTEAEWEYAARAGPAALASLDEVAWYGANSGDETHPVGTKKPNAWGLYDMLGNVREWVEDNFVRYGGAAGGGPQAARGAGGGRSSGRDGFKGGPKGGPGRALPIMRGGGWDNPANFVTLTSRYHYYGPTLRVSDIGFRVVREAL